MACCFVAAGFSLVLHKLSSTTKVDSALYTVNGLPEPDKDYKYQNVHGNTLKVSGMTCPSCVETVEAAVLDIGGINACRVSLFDSTVSYGYDAAIFKGDDLVVNAIEKIGYDVERIRINGLPRPFADDANASYMQSMECAIYALMTFGLEKLCTFDVAGKRFWLTVAAVTAVNCQFIRGKRFYLATWASFRHQTSLSMDALVAFSTTFALMLSLSFYADYMRFETPDSLLKISFELSTGTLLVITAGKHLEEMSRLRLNSNITTLGSIMPRSAVLRKDSGAVYVPISVLKKNDIVVVSPGMKFPCDGSIVKGNSFVDELALTGEPLPVEKRPGAPVLAGTLNKLTTVEILALGPATSSVISKLSSLTANDIQPADFPMSKPIKYFVPTTIILSICTFMYWMQYDLEEARMKALAVLCVSCPCALGLAIPAAVVRGMNVAATKGIFIRGSGLVKLLSIWKLKQEKPLVFVFDKTGTITTRDMTVSDFQWKMLIDDDTEKRLWNAVYSVEFTLDHPVACKIAELAISKLGLHNLTPHAYLIRDLEILKGGVKCEVELPDGIASICISNASTISNENVEGTIFFQLDGVEIASCKIDTSTRREAESVFGNLKSRGCQVIVASGDHEKRTSSLSKHLLVQEYYSNLTPAQKAELVSELSHQNLVIMVGDGLNDSDAFLEAALAITLVSSHQLAVDNADVVLMNDDLNSILELLQVARRTGIVRDANIFCCIAYNGVMIPLAMGIFSKYGISVSSYYSSAFMSVSSLLVLLNCLWIH